MLHTLHRISDIVTNVWIDISVHIYIHIKIHIHIYVCACFCSSLYYFSKTGLNIVLCFLCAVIWKKADSVNPATDSGLCIYCLCAVKGRSAWCEIPGIGDFLQLILILTQERYFNLTSNSVIIWIAFIAGYIWFTVYKLILYAVKEKTTPIVMLINVEETLYSIYHPAKVWPLLNTVTLGRLCTSIKIPPCL